MDEFQPEDELKPDASDRPAARNRKSSPGPKLPVSKQHIMIAVGILVLLLLILGIGSALKSPSGSAPASAASSGSDSKDIDLSGSAGMSGQQPAQTTTPDTSPETTAATNNAPESHDVSMPAISSAPSQGNTPASVPDQQQVTVDGNAGSVLNNTQLPASTAQSQSSLPTAPATLDKSGKLSGAPAAAAQVKTPSAVHSPAVVHRAPQANVRQSAERKAAAERESRRLAAEHRTQEQRRLTQERKAAVAERSVERHRTAEATKPASQPARPVKRESAPVPSRTVNSEARQAAKLPAGEYTLQLSGATREEALNTWAKQQNLNGYHVYQTQRNGQPWFVLVSGSYATSAEAKRAISTLPEAVRAQKPWVKPLSQVRKEAGK